jgi:hypothetical protein
MVVNANIITSSTPNSLIVEKQLKRSHRPIEEWSNQDVHRWLIDNGFKNIADEIAYNQKVDGSALLLITEDDLRLPPLSLSCLGDIKRLGKAIQQLKTYETDLSIPNTALPALDASIDEKIRNDEQ